MAFPESPRVVYEQNPLAEVICQVRFGTILGIEAEKPHQFQDLIRSAYPEYAERSPVAASLPAELPDGLRKLIDGAVGGAFPGERRVAYDFIADDKMWTISLARDFVALSTKEYKHWEEFRDRFVVVLDALESIYQPKTYSRVGLRYRDVIVRSRLELQTAPWRDLLQPQIVGELADPSFDEQAVREFRRRVRLALGDGLNLTLQHGFATAQEQPNGEQAYVIDADFYSEEKQDAAAALRTLDRSNREAGRLFRWCITKRLHDALRPSPVNVDQ